MTNFKVFLSHSGQFKAAFQKFKNNTKAVVEEAKRRTHFESPREEKARKAAEALRQSRKDAQKPQKPLEGLQA